MRGVRRFAPKRRERLLESRKGDAYYAALAGVPSRLDDIYTREIKAVKPRKAATKSATVTGRPLEKDVNADIQRINAHPRVTLWRNNRGTIELPSGAFLRYGVGPNGAADWIGYRVVRITADMVGQHIAQFAAVEAKRPGEKPDEQQQAFIEKIQFDGGRAGAAHSSDEALDILGITARI